MKLITAEIGKRLQCAYKVLENTPNTPLGEQEVIAKFFYPMGSWTWYVLNQDPADTDYLWGIVKGFEVEIGSFSLSELEQVGKNSMLGIERDIHFAPKNAQTVYSGLLEGKHF